MNAILINYLPATNTRPSRWSVRFDTNNNDNVEHRLIVSTHAAEERHPEENGSHRAALRMFLEKGYGDDINADQFILGATAKGFVAVFAFSH